MATRLSLYSAPPATLNHIASTKASRNSRLVMCTTSNPHISLDLQTGSSHHKIIKVFEDRAAGIVCYKDEDGEITCEGYDEGPRLQMSRFSCNSRDVEIVKMLQRCLAEDTADATEVFG